MSRARIQYVEKAPHALLTYTLPDAWLVPSVLLWSAVAGLAVGTLGAVMLALLGAIGYRSLDFGLVMSAIALVVTILFYGLGYLRGLRSRYLQVRFDYAQYIIDIYPAFRRQRRTRYAFDDITEFHVIDCSTAEQARCALVMERRSGPDTLLFLHRHCDDERSGLPQFAGRLNAQLALDPTYVDDDLPALPALPAIFTVEPPVPARRWSAGSAYDSEPETSEAYDLDYQQSPK